MARLSKNGQECVAYDNRSKARLSWAYLRYIDVDAKVDSIKCKGSRLIECVLFSYFIISKESIVSSKTAR